MPPPTVLVTPSGRGENCGVLVGLDVDAMGCAGTDADMRHVSWTIGFRSPALTSLGVWTRYHRG